MNEPLLSRKELGAALRRSPPYINSMVKNGFPMKSGRTTISKALTWLEKHPEPLSKKKR